MTKGEFITQYHLLCKGFRYEATAEQTDAWYRKVQQYALEDWTEAVSTLLCGSRFPLLDPAMAALDAAREQRKRVALWKDRKDAERIADAVQYGDGLALSSCLFQVIKVFSARVQVRRAKMQAAANVRETLTPLQRTVELARLEQEDQRLTAEYQRLLPMLSQADADFFTTRYGRMYGSDVAA